LELVIQYFHVLLQLSWGWMKRSQQPVVRLSVFINSTLRTVFLKTQMPSTYVKAPNFCVRTQWQNTWRRWDFLSRRLLKTCS